MEDVKLGLDIDRDREASIEKAEAKKKKIIESIGLGRGRVRCSWGVWKRVIMLLRLGDEHKVKFALLWVLSLGVLCLYTWVYYLSSIGSGNFLTLITNYSAFAPSVPSTPLAPGDNSTNSTSTSQGYSAMDDRLKVTLFFNMAKMIHESTTNRVESFPPLLRYILPFTAGASTYASASTPDDGTAAALNDFRNSFYVTLWQVLVQTVAAAFIYSFMLMLAHKIGVIWRERITNACLKEYFTGNTFYEINNFEKDLDNVDVRLATDIRLFTVNMCDFIFGTMYYNGVLPTITLSISFTILLSQVGATMGIAIAYATFAFFAILNSFIGSYVATASYKNNTASAYYLYEHQHLRNHSEHVAFYKGQDEEKQGLIDQFNLNQKQGNSLINRMLWLNFSVNCYYYLATIFSYALPGLIFLRWSDDHSPAAAASLVAATAYNSYLQLNFSYAILLSEVNSAVMNYGLRVGELFERLTLRSSKANQLQGKKLYTYDSLALSVRNVMCKTPDGKILLDNLNLDLQANQNLIIMGPSGSGKSSILRILCGLWPIDDPGHISLPCAEKGGMFFLPQKPYLTLGTLREQFFYPSAAPPSTTGSTDKIILDLLKQVDMEYILGRFELDTIADWAVTLSVGEQQRIGMARLFYHRPRFCILDESTSAVDSSLESKFYSRCVELGLRYISVAHRKSVIRYHDVLLQLDNNHNYTVTPITEEKPSQES
jgi:putative ATP-binding cassette transporter